MVPYLKTKINHVYTKDELLKDLDRVIDSTKDTIGPDQLANLQKVRAGINQLYARIDQARETIANLQKVNSAYVSKVESLAQQVNHPRARFNQPRANNENFDKVEKALQKLKESVSMY